MMNADMPTYKLTVSHTSFWYVGYSPIHDEMFLVRMDADRLCWVFRKSGLDVVGFEEFFNWKDAIDLGEL